MSYLLPPHSYIFFWLLDVLFEGFFGEVQSSFIHLPWEIEIILKLLSGTMQKLQQETMSSTNMNIVDLLAEEFSRRPDDYMPWLVKSCNNSNFSKTLLFLVIMKSFIKSKSSMFSPLNIKCFSYVFFLSLVRP